MKNSSRSKPAQILLILYLLALLLPQGGLVYASPASVLISEIMYDPSGADTNHEWIEIQNISDAEIDLVNWKLWEENVNHKLTLVQGSTLLQPAGYAILTGSGGVFLQDHSGFEGHLFSVVFSLNNTGESMGMKDASGILADEIAYSSSTGGGGNGKTLERSGLSEFQESLMPGGTPGQDNTVEYDEPDIDVPENGNQNFSLNTNSSNDNGNGTSGEENTNGSPDMNQNNNTSLNFNQNDNSQTNANNNSAPNANTNQNVNGNGNTNSVPVPAGAVLINEIYSHPLPGESEWIELYNPTTADINLSPLTLTDNTGSPARLSGILQAHGYLVLEPSPKALNNDGDTLRLTNETGETVDQMSYGTAAANAPLPVAGKSVGRYPDGMDTGSDRNDFKLLSTVSKGTTNVYVANTEASTAPGNNHPPVAVITLQSPYKTSGPAPLRLNVTGENSSDRDGDHLTFFWQYGEGSADTRENPLVHAYEHPGSYTLKLIVTDEAGATGTAEISITVLPPPSDTEEPETAEETQTCAPDSGSGLVMISEVLPNPIGADSQDEFVELYNESEGVAVSLCGWQLGDASSKVYTIPEGTVLSPQGYLVFPVTETHLSLNNDADEIRLWDASQKLQDGIAYQKAPAGKSYARIQTLPATEGSYAQWLWTVPTPGSMNEHLTPIKQPAEFVSGPVMPESDPVHTTVDAGNVLISELYADPPGADSGKEWLELINVTDKTIQLEHYYLQNKNKKKFILTEGVIPPGGLYVVKFTGSTFHLTNTNDVIELHCPDGSLCDKAAYKESKSQKSFVRREGDEGVYSFILTAAPTPGKANKVVAGKTKAKVTAKKKPAKKRVTLSSALTAVAQTLEGEVAYAQENEPSETAPENMIPSNDLTMPQEQAMIPCYDRSMILLLGIFLFLCTIIAVLFFTRRTK